MKKQDEWVSLLEILRRELGRAEDSTRRALDQIDCASRDDLPVDYVAKQIGLAERSIANAQVAATQVSESLAEWLKQFIDESAARRKLRA